MVQQQKRSNLRLELAILGNSYVAGDWVQAQLSLTQLNRGPIGQKAFRYKVILDGQPLFIGQGCTDSLGKSLFEFELPDSIQAKEGQIQLFVEHKGQTASIGQHIPFFSGDSR